MRSSKGFRAAGVAAVLLCFSGCAPASAAPTRVSDFRARAATWRQLAVGPPDCAGTALACNDVATEVFKWARAAWGAQVVSAERLQQVMLDNGFAELSTTEARANALRLVGADALLAVKIAQVTTPVPVPGQIQAPTVSIEVRVFAIDREAPIAIGQETRGAFSEWGAVQRTIRILISDIFAR